MTQICPWGKVRFLNVPGRGLTPAAGSCKFPSSIKILILVVALVASGARLVMGAPEATLDLDEIPAKGATRVWSPLFQACWDQLHQAQVGKIEKVEPPNELISRLQKFQWDEKKVMPKDGYAVYVGPTTQALTDEAEASIKKKFEVEVDLGEVSEIPGGKSAFGFLLRDLKFEKKFYRSKNSGLEFRSGDGKKHLVEYFGCAGSYSGAFHEHVKVLHYENAGASFMVSVSTETEGESLVIYRPENRCSFREGIEKVKGRMGAPLEGGFGSLQDGAIHRRDVLKIPSLELETDTDFSAQLKGGIFSAGNKEGSVVDRESLSKDGVQIV